MAVGERFRRYHNAPENGWHAKTLRDVMYIYAPPPKNKTEDYINWLAPRMGVDPRQELNFDDPEIMASFIQHVPRYEHGIPLGIGREEALAAARDVLAGKKPVVTGRAPDSGRGFGGALHEIGSGFSPAQKQAWLAKAAAIDRQKYAGAAAELGKICDSYMAASRDGHVQDIPVTQAQLMQVLGEDKGNDLWQKLNQSHALAVDLSGLATLPDAEQDALLQSRAPNPQSADYLSERAYFTDLARAVTDIQKRRAKDPAAFLAQTNPQAMQAQQLLLTQLNPQSWQHYRSVMEPLLAAQGLPADRLLSTQAADALGNWLVNADDPAQASQRLQLVFGSDFPDVMKTIAPKLNSDIALLAGGIKPEAARLVMDGLRDPDFEKKAFSLFRLDTKQSDFNNEVMEELDKYARSFLGSASSDLASALQKHTRILALQYMQRLGLGQTDAIKRATQETIAGRYVIADNYIPERGGIFSSGDPAPGCRIPKQFNGKDLDTDAIESGLRQTLTNLNPDTLDLKQYPNANPDTISETYKNLLIRNAYWLTNENETGAILFMDGKAVRSHDGKIITRTWQELANAAWQPEGEGYNSGDY